MQLLEYGVSYLRNCHRHEKVFLTVGAKTCRLMDYKLEPSMLKTLPIIPSSTSQNIYPLFLFYSHSLPITPILFFCFIVLCIDI